VALCPSARFISETTDVIANKFGNLDRRVYSKLWDECNFGSCSSNTKRKFREDN
jgi:hypothetical protein